MSPDLFGNRIVSTDRVAGYLDGSHYLGRARRGIAWEDEYGVLVLASPTSRRLPSDRWLELVRWCLVPGVPGGGSRQWAAVRRYLVAERPDVTTVVSYSDPSAGHTGALYRACGFLWAPTWHRLRPPPSGNGVRSGRSQAVKDRWVDPLRVDVDRERLLRVEDDALRARYPDAEYRDPLVRRRRLVRGTGGGRYRPPED